MSASGRCCRRKMPWRSWFCYRGAFFGLFLAGHRIPIGKHRDERDKPLTQSLRGLLYSQAE